MVVSLWFFDEFSSKEAKPSIVIVLTPLNAIMRDPVSIISSFVAIDF